MWLDARIVREDLGRAMNALATDDAIGLVVVDVDPPAAGPESEISVRLANGLNHLVPIKLLRDHGVSVIAYRVRAWERRP